MLITEINIAIYSISMLKTDIKNGFFINKLLCAPDVLFPNNEIRNVLRLCCDVLRH